MFLKCFLRFQYFEPHVSLLKHYIVKKRNFPVTFVNVSLTMFLKCFLRFQYFEPHVSYTCVS